MAYKTSSPSDWTGRIDSTENFDAFRWHQWVKLLDLSSETLKPFEGTLGIALLGFCSDTGVRRNLGRAGAVNGPKAIRKELCNMPCWFESAVHIFDAGDIHCIDDDLESAQAELSVAVKKLISLNLFPIVLGGGHETAYGHYNGLKSVFKEPIGIVNFDAHFDLRPYPNGGTSGTMFRQIAEDCLNRSEPYHYLCIGVQRYGNTVDLFKTAERLGVHHILSKDLIDLSAWQVVKSLEDFTDPLEHLYVTICIDVFSSAFAPGVSATQPLGMDPELAFQMLKYLFKTQKVRGFDICEVSPRFDQDSTTANLAKVLIFSAVNALAHLHGVGID